MDKETRTTVIAIEDMLLKMDGGNLGRIYYEQGPEAFTTAAKYLGLPDAEIESCLKRMQKNEEVVWEFMEEREAGIEEDEWEEDDTDDKALDDSMQLAFDSFWRTIGEAHNRADLQRTSVAYSFLLQSINYLKKVGWGEEELLMEAKTQYRNHNVVAKAKKTGPA